MASMGGKVGAANQSHYAASKAAVISLTQVAAAELGAHGITVNSICPGYVLTEMGAGDANAGDDRRVVVEVTARPARRSVGRGRDGPLPGVE